MTSKFIFIHFVTCNIPDNPDQCIYKRWEASPASSLISESGCSPEDLCTGGTCSRLVDTRNKLRVHEHTGKYFQLLQFIYIFFKPEILDYFLELVDKQGTQGDLLNHLF